MTAAVFLSYRRAVASGSAGRLYDAMTHRLGESSVFMDVDGIQPGDDFVEVLDRTLAACRVVVVVIDPAWLDAQDGRGRRRLDNPRDVVRLEVENALRHRARVIPVLVEGAEMPVPDELPPSIRALADRHAVEISASRFRYDAGRLIDAVERAIRAPQPAAPPVVAPAAAAEPGAGDPRISPVPGLTLRHDVTSRPIAADPLTVWDVLTDVALIPELNPSSVRSTPLSSGPPRLGYRYRVVERSFGVFRVTTDWEILRFDPPRHLAEAMRLQRKDEIVNVGQCLLTTVDAFTVVRTVGHSTGAAPTPDLVGQWLARLADLAEAEQARRS